VRGRGHGRRSVSDREPAATYHRGVERVPVLVEKIREAEASGGTWDLAEVGGRRALRVRHADGVETSFLSEDEERELTAQLAGGPAALRLDGLPTLWWNARRHAFVGEVDGLEIVVSAPMDPKQRKPKRLAALAGAYERTMARLDDIPREAAEKLLPKAAAWRAPTKLADLAARFDVVAISFSAESSHHARESTIWLSDGDAFAGHRIEVRLDPDGLVRSVGF